MGLCMFMQVITDKHAHHVATLLDTKGPEIRTAMLRGGKDIELQAGQARNANVSWLWVLLIGSCRCLCSVSVAFHAGLAL
jgi:hypothetical protein